MRSDVSIQVISLSSDCKKRDSVSAVLDSYNLNYSFYDAVNGKELSAIEYFYHCNNNDYFFNRKFILTPGEVGCKLSHLKILEDFVNNQSDYNWLCVLEDDISLKYDLNIVFNNLSEIFSKSIIHLGGQEGLNSKNRVVKSFKGSFDKLNYYKVLPITLRWLYRTCGYIVSKEIALEMLSIFKENNIPADNWRYIVKKSSVRDFIFCDVVTHPVDLSSSSIEAERGV